MDTRRSFLKRVAAASSFSIVPARVLFGADAPSNQLTRALIGFGGIAHSENHLPYKGSRLIGLCDPDQLRVKGGLAAAAKCGWGNCMSVMAANAGKDIWCEKPMTRTVGEGKRVMEVVKAKKRIFRLNTWFRFQGNFYGFGTTVKPIRQVVESGLLGKGPIKCTFGGGQGFSWKFYWSGRVNLPVQAVPKTFDWDMWLGPAPWKPYNRHRTHGTFRGYWDYDGGGLGDMAQHYLDPLQYLLCKDDTSPVKVDYIGPKQHPDVVGRFDRFVLTYADGTEVILDGDNSLKDEPLLRGSNGVCVYKKAKNTSTLRIKDKNGWWPDAKVVAFLKELPEPAPQITDFMESVRTRKPFALNETNGFRSCTMFNLAIVAERLGRGFKFDPMKLRAVNDEAADRFLYQSMRQPWAKEMWG